MKHSAQLLGLLLLTGAAYGQDPETYASDAFRFSDVTQTGTARFRGLGGNQAALGGDASTIFGNPAGLGFYNRSEFSFSPSLNLVNSTGTYNNTSQTYSRALPNIGHLGLVLAGNSQKENRKWRRTALGISYSQQTNFLNAFQFGTRNLRSSIVDTYVNAANRRNISSADLNNEYNAPAYQADNLEAAAYQLFLIDPTVPQGQQTGGPPYYRYPISAQGDRNAPLDQQNTFRSSGAHSQWSIAYAGNLEDKLYIGISGSLTRLRYYFENEFREDVVGGRVFNNYSQIDELNVRGSGVSASLGVIYKPDRNFQLGLNVTSPTFTSVNETFDQRLRVSASDPNLPIERNEISILPATFEYRLISPLRAAGGATVFLGDGKIGFLTATAEYVGYEGMRVRTSYFSGVGDNTAFGNDVRDVVKGTYQNVVNFRAGAEFRAGLLRIRGGAAYLPDPYQEGQRDLDRARLLFSGGLGMRNDRFFADLSGTFFSYKQAYTPYTLPNSTDYGSGRVDTRTANITLSAGVFF